MHLTTSVEELMKIIVKAFERDGQEFEFENKVIGDGNEVLNEKAAAAFIEGIRISFPSTFQYRIIPKKAEGK